MAEPVHAVDASVPVPEMAGNEEENPHTLQWLAQNREAIRSSNSYVEVYGLPLAKNRLY
ncbi:type II toxin-antitoxin system CcdA family antitoxin [Azospirillum sp. A29]|jgi:post-segregation antitoxin (ccd killing protein)|uniref:type II toxin-antitoxin system CcdA family antitoxin n=1 Tax=Azospirillum sp. A29 TaxID=3160606 RepID=UPI00366C1969